MDRDTLIEKLYSQSQNFASKESTQTFDLHDFTSDPIETFDCVSWHEKKDRVVFTDITIVDQDNNTVFSHAKRTQEQLEYAMARWIREHDDLLRDTGTHSMRYDIVTVRMPTEGGHTSLLRAARNVTLPPESNEDLQLLIAEMVLRLQKIVREDDIDRIHRIAQTGIEHVEKITHVSV